MRKIEIIKKEDKFTFAEPLANEMLDFRIDSGELKETLIELQEQAAPYQKLKADDLTESKQNEMNRVLVKINLAVAKINKVNYAFAVKHLVAVESKSLSLEDVQSLKIPMASLEDVFAAFNEALASEADEGKK